MAMSAIGTKRTYRVALHMSAFGGKAVTHMFSRGKRNLNGSAVLVGTEDPMGKLKAILSATTLIWFVSTPSSAMPFSAQTIISTDWNVKNAQLVCDEFGRCWQTRSAPYAYPSARSGDAVNVDPALGRQYAALYAPVYGERFPIPAVRLSDINPAYLRTAVFYPTQ